MALRSGGGAGGTRGPVLALAGQEWYVASKGLTWGPVSRPKGLAI